jgi:hypothetical protein
LESGIVTVGADLEEVAIERCPMPRVVPSQVVAFIKSLWPTSHDLNNITRSQAGQLSGLVKLVDQIPSELLVMDAATYPIFVCATAHISQRLATWISVPDRGHDLGFMPGATQLNPVTEIRDALAKCRDEPFGSATSKLNFIPDNDLRRSLLMDIGAIDRALSNGEWKGATVLAGSAIEALLLWALQRDTAASTAAAAALVAATTLSRQPNADLERWDLHEYTEVASHRGIIKSDTATETRLAREFRNLIHPGRSQRLGQKCDRGTALSSVAALDHVVRDLS